MIHDRPNKPGTGPDRAILTDQAFERVQLFAGREAGLSIPASKRAMVQSRIARRLSVVGLADFIDYLDFVESPAGQDEKDELLSVLVTNVSHFFREVHHFDTLRTEVIPGLLETAAKGGRIRIWSAACSSGQEPYSIAMCLLEAEPNIARLDVKILATDIDKNILTLARAGHYDITQIDGIPDAYQSKYLTPVTDLGGTTEVTQSVRDLVTFRRLNLMQPWPMREKLDAIFCRNVVIYFSQDTQDALWPRFEDALKPGGWLFLGHSERIRPNAKTAFVSKGITTYRRAAAD